jgi:2-desacetyl-2-hydroxyethyl bacteriochlorophyllide A dehydrogenase
MTPMPEAVWFSAPRQVEIREEPQRPVRAGEVRVQALVSGVSAGSELLVYAGDAPADMKPDLPTLVGDFGLPMKFGYASVGRVTELGPEVDQLALGECVFALHPHQTEYVVPTDLAVRLPDQLRPEMGVFTANLETAVTVTLDAHPRLAESVLVVGQGVLGLMITMLMRRAGASPVISVERYPQRREASKGAGADHALNADDPVAPRVRELTDGRGVDVAIDVSGNPVGLQSAIDSVAFGGRVVAASWYGAREVKLRLGDTFHKRRVRMISSQVSTLDPDLAPRWDRARRTAVVIDLLGRLDLSPLVTHRFPYREAAAAYELLNRSPADCLQVVLTYV